MNSPLESLKYDFIKTYDFEALEALTNKLIQIETYDLHDAKETAIVYGAFRPYKRSLGAISAFYVNAYDDPCGNGTDLLYSFDNLDEAVDLVKELQNRVTEHYSKK